MDAAVSPFAVFVDRLITLIASLAPAADSTDTQAFKAKLEEYRQVVLDPTRKMEVARVTEQCIQTCEVYFKLSRKVQEEREAEFTEIIKILKDAAKIAVGDSRDFNLEVADSTQRLQRLTNLEDLQEMKRRLVSEVAVLRKAVEEKQQRDDRAYAQLTARVEALQSHVNEVEEEAALDPLTRVANRGRFNRTLKRMMETARQNGTPLSLALLDVDNFKAINDTHGHAIGDRVIICVAQWLTKKLRQTDFVARFGGEEFAVLLEGAPASQVEERLQELLGSIANSSYEYELLGKKELVRFTLSCGLADHHAGETEEEFVHRTDDALYEAKRKGRNRLVSRRKHGLMSFLSWG